MPVTDKKTTTAVPKPHEALGRRLRAQTSGALAAERRAETLVRVARQAMDAAESDFTELQKNDSVAREVAGLDCRKYCAACCYKTVSATPAEVLYLADYIGRSFTPKALRQLKARLRRLDEKTQGMSPAERGRAQLPCALLVAKLCSAHPARPASCRGFNSRDVGKCEASLRHREVEIPVYAPQLLMFAHAHMGLRQGLADAGLGSTHLELTAALRIALETPDAADRYLAGEPVFRRAEQP
jgi:Fe-S-cluster containining protein